MADTTERDQYITDIAAGNHDSLQRFERIAQRDPAAWRQLALTLHDELHMRHELAASIDEASRSAATAEINRAHTQHADRSVLSTARWGAWSGWAVAAVLLLAMLVIVPGQSAHHVTPPGGSATVANLTAQQALEQYITTGTEEGRVISELPTVLVEARPLDDGRLEVLYLRQFLEREHVNEVYALNTDELGEAHPVKVDVSTFAPFDSSL